MFAFCVIYYVCFNVEGYGYVIDDSLILYALKSLPCLRVLLKIVSKFKQTNNIIHCH